MSKQFIYISILPHQEEESKWQKRLKNMELSRGQCHQKKEKKKKIAKVEKDPRAKPYFSGLQGETRAQRKN